MEDLPPRKVQQQNPTIPPVNDDADLDNAEIRQEEARTIRYAVSKLNEFLQWFIVVLEITLAMRFFLKLIGADPQTLFAGFVYVLTEIILFPFVGIVPSWQIGQRQGFELSVLIAMVVYWLLFWAIRRFLRILVSNPDDTATV